MMLTTKRRETVEAKPRAGQKPVKLIDRIDAMIGSIDPRDPSERMLVAEARVLVDLARDAGEGRYGMLSMLAYSEMMVALLDFADGEDGSQAGMPRQDATGLRNLAEVCCQHRAEIGRYQESQALRGRFQGTG